MVFRARRKNLDGGGFTLLEILLTVALLIALLGAVVYNFQSAQRGADLDEGTRQVEALIRFAGAQAASSGKMVQLRFGDDATTSSGTNSTSNASTDASTSLASDSSRTNAVNDFESIDDLAERGAKLRVVYESDPVLQPGVFIDLPEAKPFLDAIGDRVRVDKVTMPARPLNQGTNDLAAAQEVAPLTSVTFYPDGSSDTADIALVSKEREDYREMIVHVDGVTGSIRRELKSGDDLVPIEWMEDENSPQRQQAQNVTDNTTERSTPTTQASSDATTPTATQTAPMPEDPAFEQLDKPKTENTKTNAFDDFP